MVFGVSTGDGFLTLIKRRILFRILKF